MHGLLLDLAGAMNSPQSIAALLQEAGVSLDRALFPLLARIDRHGAMGIMELGEMVGRDHTTVSRQVAQLEQMGLVSRRVAATDKRVRHAVIVPAGPELIASASYCDLNAFYRWMVTERRDELAVGAQIFPQLIAHTERLMQFRDAHPEVPIVDVHHQEFRKTPLTVLRAHL